MINVQDQLNTTLTFSTTPKRIVSLVPSLTELLYDLGLGNFVVGRTKFCIHPAEMVSSASYIGGTKTVDVEKVKSLEPDLIIASKEENLPEPVHKLKEDLPVFVSDIKTIEGSFDAIRAIGEITGTSKKAEEIIKGQRRILEEYSRDRVFPVAYLIWREPYMTIGADTYINDMLKALGFENVFQDRLRYPEITLEDLKDGKPRFIFLSSEPYPFKEKHIPEIQEAVPYQTTMIVDGEIFSWYGSRLLHKKKELSKLLGVIRQEKTTA